MYISGEGIEQDRKGEEELVKFNASTLLYGSIARNICKKYYICQ